MGTPRQRGDCAMDSGLSFAAAAAASATAAATSAPATPRSLPCCAPPTSGGIFPSGGSMTIDVRLPVLRTELKTAL